MATPAFGEDVARAATAFGQAQEAMLAGDAAGAADLYELADNLAPSAPALRNAARARYAAGHLATAATLAAEMLRRYPSDNAARKVAEAMLSDLAPKLTPVDVTCKGGCTLVVDAGTVPQPIREEHAFFVQPGRHTITARFSDERTTSIVVTAIAGKAESLRLVAPPKPVIAPKSRVTTEPRGNRGIKRRWVAISAVVTVGLGVGAVVSGLQTMDTRDQVVELVDAGEDTAAADLFNRGRDQQIRTNILIGTSAAAGVTTVVLAVMTNWSGESRERGIAVVPTRGGMAIGYLGRF